MAKSVKKKTNRRLKRSVRRTLGALCMITSIIVATIPFPDAAAEPIAETIPYSYYSGAAPKIDIENPDISGMTKGTAYTISKPSSGNWQMDWQFEYHATSAGSDGFISKYNSQYQVDEIDLQYRVYSDYINISEEQVSEYYSPTDAMQEKVKVKVMAGDVNVKIAEKEIYNLGHIYELDGDPESCPDHNFFYNNAALRPLYDEYKTAYTNYTNHLGQPDEANYPKPEKITKTYKDIYTTDQAQVQFFCDQVFGEGTDMYLQIVDKRVYDLSGNATGWKKVYVPRLNNPLGGGTDTTTIGGLGYYADSNLFLADKFAALIGIAKEAFKEVTNVRTLTMAKEISYIGDSAFEDSFLAEVTLSMDAKVGNRAFANCKRLQGATIPEGVKKIGSEAFAGTSLREVVIPDSVEIIGNGAFNNCGNLKNVTFNANSSADKTIGDYAFFDCSALESISFGDSHISSIGKCAFALSRVPTAQLKDFKFPNYITDASKIGEYFFGKRDGLETVTMPNNLGNASNTAIPGNIFWGCTGLQSVTFPESCKYVTYPNTLFKEVTNPTFYVRGPKTTGVGNTPASPRTSTWVAYFNNSTDYHVPYVYNEGGRDYYEISDKDNKYILIVEEDGMLSSCNFVGSPSDIDEPFIIPATVGTTTVTGISDGCFNDPDLGVLDYIHHLVIEDGSQITTISDNVFKGADKLDDAKIGDSVTTIGKEAFADCPTLEKVEFGSGITSIGNAAFKNCPDLVEMVFDSPANGPDSFPISNIGSEAFSTGAPKLTVTGDVAEGYAPFAWSMQSDNFVNPSTGVRVCYKTHEPSNLTIILDNANNLPTLVDYPQYDDLASEIKTKYESGTAITPAEEALIKATTDIVIPGGVKSIDAKGYFNGDSKSSITPAFSSNQASIDAYFTSGGGALGLDYTKYKDAGLFAADFLESLPAEEETESKGVDRLKSVTMNSVEYLPDGCFYSCEGLELVDLGTGITDVGSLPFENCTKLVSVGCSNNNFACNNGILYENMPDGSKRLAECLAGRGNVVGSSTVSVENDPDLVNVSEIAPAAFRNCKSITGADFTDANNFNEIPDQCFKGSEMLNEVDLPANVKIIGEEAFADTGAYTKVYVRGTEVGFGKNAYDGVRQPYLVSYKDSAVRLAAQRQGVNVDETLDEMHTVKFYMPDGKTLIKTAMVEDGGSAKKEAPDDEEMETFLKEGQKLYGWNGAEDIKAITKDCFFIAKIGLANGIDTDGDGIPDKPADGDNGDNGNNNGNNNSGNNNSGNNNNGNNNNGNNNTGNNNGNGSASEDNVQKYTLTVVYGDGSGVYASGTKVIISAIEPPAGKEFYKWTTTNTGVTITSATSAATTVKTTNSDATVTATYRDKSTVSGNTVNRKPIGSSTGNSGTSVQITKPGISNTDKAYASVSGSTDNFVVKISESSAAADAVATALANKYGDMNPIKYFAMDITLYDKNGNAVTNTNGLSVNITMPIPDALVQYGGNNKVGAVVNGNVLEDLNCKFTTVSGIPCVTFTATHFSPYTIYVDTSNLSVNTLDSTPKTGDGIHPKWFLSLGLLCISILLFMKKDKVTPRKAIVS